MTDGEYESYDVFYGHFIKKEKNGVFDGYKVECPIGSIPIGLQHIQDHQQPFESYDVVVFVKKRI